MERRSERALRAAGDTLRQLTGSEAERRIVLAVYANALQATVDHVSNRDEISAREALDRELQRLRPDLADSDRRLVVERYTQGRELCDRYLIVYLKAAERERDHWLDGASIELVDPQRGGDPVLSALIKDPRIEMVATLLEREADGPYTITRFQGEVGQRVRTIEREGLEAYDAVLAQMRLQSEANTSTDYIAIEDANGNDLVYGISLI